MYYFFSTPHCPNCPAAKKLLSQQSFGRDLCTIDASTPKGLDLAQRFGIQQVPALVITDKDDTVEQCYLGLNALFANFSETSC